MDITAKLEAFRAKLEADQITRLIKEGLSCDANIANARTRVEIAKKYARVNIGDSGRYMVDLATGEIFGIKGYGQIHRGHRYGTLDTIEAWDWGNYAGTARRT